MDWFSLDYNFREDFDAPGPCPAGEFRRNFIAGMDLCDRAAGSSAGMQARHSQ